MCGLPTETDEDVLQIAELARRVIEAGRKASGTQGHPLHRRRSAASCPSRTRPSSGPRSSTTRPPTRACTSCATRSAPTAQYGKAIGFRYHDGRPGIVEGLLSPRRPPRRRRHRAGVARRRALRRLERALLVRPLDGRAPTSRSPTSRSTSTGTRPASASRPRCCPGTTSTPASTRTGSGRTGRTRCPRSTVEDCRWTPCFDCGVCDQMGTEIQVGPTGRRPCSACRRCRCAASPVLARRSRRPEAMARQAPVRDVAPTVQRLRLRYAKRGRLRFTSTATSSARFERALRRTGVPMAYSQGFNPHPRISYANAAPTGTASEAEYVEIAVTAVLDPDKVREALDEALPPGLDVLEVVEVRTPDFADRLQASVWTLELPGVADRAGRGRRCGVPRRRRGRGPAAHEVRHADVRRARPRDPARGAPRAAGGCRGRRGRALCDTRPGRTARNPVRPTRRRPRRVCGSWPTSCRRSPLG